MKLVLTTKDGETKKYPLNGAMSRPTLNDVMLLKMQTGMGLAAMQEAVGKFDVGNLAAAMDDLDALQAMRGMIWLVRRQAGEKLTVDEACDFPMDTLDVEDEPGDEPDAEVTADPTTGTTGGDPGTAVPVDVPAATSPTTTTLKLPS